METNSFKTEQKQIQQSNYEFEERKSVEQEEISDKKEFFGCVHRKARYILKHSN